MLLIRAMWRSPFLNGPSSVLSSVYASPLLPSRGAKDRGVAFQAGSSWSLYLWCAFEVHGSPGIQIARGGPMV